MTASRRPRRQRAASRRSQADLCSSCGAGHRHLPAGRGACGRRWRARVRCCPDARVTRPNRDVPLGRRGPRSASSIRRELSRSSRLYLFLIWRRLRFGNMRATMAKSVPQHRRPSKNRSVSSAVQRSAGARFEYDELLMCRVPSIVMSASLTDGSASGPVATVSECSSRTMRPFSSRTCACHRHKRLRSPPPPPPPARG